jgi:hypothetical protein
MASPDDTARRVARLEQILAETTGATTVGTSGADAANVHLNSVPLERIRLLTEAVQTEAPRSIDQVDGVMMTLLLHEYASAVAHLRAVVRTAASAVDGADEPLSHARRAVDGYERELEAAPADAQEDVTERNRG